MWEISIVEKFNLAWFPEVCVFCHCRIKWHIIRVYYWKNFKQASNFRNIFSVTGNMIDFAFHSSFFKGKLFLLEKKNNAFFCWTKKSSKALLCLMSNKESRDKLSGYKTGLRNKILEMNDMKWKVVPSPRQNTYFSHLVWQHWPVP